jgi:phosphatidylglycerophosphate synthase
MANMVGRKWIPWGMAAGRAALGPVLIAGAACGWNPLALAGMVVAAMVSDIFDGVLARRWGTDTAGVRLFDSMADTVFYLCTAVALWVARPEVLRANAALLGALLALEVVRFAFDLAKFGKAVSYHSYLAKVWGLVMAVAVTAVFAMGRGNRLVAVALGLGIACNLEGLAMSMVLRVWRRDVKWIGEAWRIRTGQGSRVTSAVRGAFASALIAAILLGAAPAFAVGAGEVAYTGGTSASIPNGTIGKLDVAGAERLVFRTASTASVGEIDIPYSTITNFQYSTEVAHHIGVLPAIAVGMVKKRERKHFFTISYSDSSNGVQVAIFEVPKGEPPALLAILRARAAQACGKQALNYCGGNLGGANGW